MASEQREGTPLSNSGSLSGADPFAGLGGPTSGRATTTERRTTTTTTTKRTIKSSDDFMPTATDIQQVRSESRTGSISSTSSPLFSPLSSQSQQQHQSSSQHEKQQQQQTSSTTSSSKPSTTTAATNQHTSKNWSSSTTTTTTSTSGAENLQSPLIQDTEEGRVLKLRFDVTQYEPDEIVVKTVDNRLTVHAKHEERSENRSVYREYNREFHLPDGIDIEQIKSSLSKDGILTVDCPLPQTQLPGASRRIPIDRA
jgi:HSP20 family molecular chaperone IbpA